MAVLVVQEVTRTGAAAAAKVACAAGGDTFVNNGKTWLEFANASGGTLTVTVAALRNCDQGFDHDVVVGVPAGATNFRIGPFPQSNFNGSGGVANITYSGVTTLTVGAVKIS